MKSIKDKIKAKAKSVKDKLKGSKSSKSSRKCAAIVAALGLSGVAAALSGCATADPASRANDNKVGDIEPTVKVVMENSSSNTVSVVVKTTLGDGLLASADSAGSTETQTATPTTSIPIRIDARYNDALAAASTTSRSVLGTIGEGLGAVLDLMASKKDGTVTVQKTDGTTATVECKDGQCTFAR